MPVGQLRRQLRRRVTGSHTFFTAPSSWQAGPPAEPTRESSSVARALPTGRHGRPPSSAGSTRRGRHRPCCLQALPHCGGCAAPSQDHSSVLVVISERMPRYYAATGPTLPGRSTPSPATEKPFSVRRHVSSPRADGSSQLRMDRSEGGRDNRDSLTRSPTWLLDTGQRSAIR